MSTDELRMDPAANIDPTAVTPELEPISEVGAGSAPGAKTTDPVLGDELREFGKQIEGLFQTARSSPRGKELETQLTSAWRDVEKGVNEAISKAQAADLKGTVAGTAQYATDEAQNALARGLKNLNHWLAQKRQEAEARRKQREAAAGAAAMAGTADNEIADRFSGSDLPVFDPNIPTPAASINVPPDADAINRDNPIADRFDDEIKL